MVTTWRNWKLSKQSWDVGGNNRLQISPTKNDIAIGHGVRAQSPLCGSATTPMPRPSGKYLTFEKNYQKPMFRVLGMFTWLPSKEDGVDSTFRLFSTVVDNVDVNETCLRPKSRNAPTHRGVYFISTILVDRAPPHPPREASLILLRAWSALFGTRFQYV